MHGSSDLVGQSSSLLRFRDTPHSSRRVIGQSQRPLPDHTEHSKAGDILGLCEDRNHSSSKQTAAKPCLRVATGISDNNNNNNVNNNNVTEEITLHVTQIVNTEHLQQSIP